MEPSDESLIMRSAEDPSKAIEWIRKRKMRLKGVKARLGDLSDVDLEEEFKE